MARGAKGADYSSEAINRRITPNSNTELWLPLLTPSVFNCDVNKL